MAIKIKATVVTLANTAVDEVMSDGNGAVTISKIIACNTDTLNHNITIFHDDTGTRGAVTDTIILKNYPIAAGASPTLPLSSIFLPNGAKLFAEADTGGVINLSINYTSDAQ